MCPSQNRFHPGQQLQHLKGLDHVIIRTHAKPLHPIGKSPFCRQKNSRDLPGLPVHLKAIQAGKHNIQKHQIEGLFFQHLHRRFPVIHRSAPVSDQLQISPEQLIYCCLIFYNQNLCHSSPSFFLFLFILLWTCYEVVKIPEALFYFHFQSRTVHKKAMEPFPAVSIALFLCRFSYPFLFSKSLTRRRSSSYCCFCSLINSS